MTPLRSIHEIEGSAQVGQGPVTLGMGSADLDSPPAVSHFDGTDDLIRAHLPARRWRLAVDESALCPVEIHNAGDVAADFRAQVLDANGDPLDPEWVTMTPPHLRLDPGQRASIILALTPPRSPRSRAGDHPLTVVVTSPHHPGRRCAVSATLTVLPFSDLRVEPPLPARLAVSWRRPDAALVLPVENLGNQEVTLGLALAVADGERGLVADFGLMGAGGEELRLEPGRRLHLPVEVRCRPRALLGVAPAPVSLALTVTADQRPAATVQAQLMVQPVFSGAKMLLVGALGVMALAVAGVMAGLTWLSVGSATGLPPTPNPAAATRQVQAVTQDLRTLIVVVPPAAVVPTQVEGETAAEAVAPSILAGPEPLPFSPSDPLPAAPMTYEAMFREVAGAYGLSWQILAALAYVESRLDPGALGKDGDMGLMQIIPATWGEWAVRAGVDPATPYNAYGNVRVGAAYLAHLRAELAEDGHPEDAWALAAYNWGLKNVRGVLAGGQGWDGLPKKQQQYVTDILNLAGSIEEQN